MIVTLIGFTHQQYLNGDVQKARELLKSAGLDWVRNAAFGMYAVTRANSQEVAGLPSELREQLGNMDGTSFSKREIAA